MPPPARRRHLSPWVSPVSPRAPHTVPPIRPSPLPPHTHIGTDDESAHSERPNAHPLTPPPQVGSPPHGPNPTDARLATHGQTREEYELDPNHYERAGVRGERHQLHIDDQDSEDDDTNSGSDTRSVFNDPAGFYPEEPAARKAYGRLLAHRQDAEERARRHDEQHPPGVQGQVQARRRVAPDRGDDSTAIVRTGRTVAETALADARVKSRKANVAEIAAFVRTAGGTAGVGGVAADAMYGQANRNDLISPPRDAAKTRRDLGDVHQDSIAHRGCRGGRRDGSVPAHGRRRPLRVETLAAHRHLGENHRI